MTTAYLPNRRAAFPWTGLLLAAGAYALWRMLRGRSETERQDDRIVDESSEQSFPASDPPSFNARG